MDAQNYKKGVFENPGKNEESAKFLEMFYRREKAERLINN